MARKGQFRKGGGRHGHAKTRTRTVVKTKYRTRGARKHRRSRRRRHGGGHGGISIAKLAIAGAGLAYLTSAAKSPIRAIPDNIAKVPGAKTFGNAATAGLILLGVDRFVKKNPWIRAAGIVGVVLGAAQVGTQGSDFKWLGDGSDVGDEYTGDIEGDDDIGDMEGDD